jgi:hypothetical protein
LNIGDSAFDTGGHEDLVIHSRAFFDHPQHVAAGYGRARLDGWRKRPTSIRI